MDRVKYAAWLLLPLGLLVTVPQASTNGQVLAYALIPAALFLAGWSLLPERL